MHHGLGLKAEPLSAEDARELEPALGDDLAAAVLRPDEASVDNRELTRAALIAAERAGAQIFSGGIVQSICRDDRNDGNSRGEHQQQRCHGLLVDGKKIAARWTVISAGCYSATIEGAEAFAPVRPAKGQMLSLRAPNLKINRVLWSEQVYLVPRNDGRILAGATVEYVGFEKGVTGGAIHKILAGALELAPGLANAQIAETWAGLRPDSPDHLPIIGPTDIEGLLMATGHFRSGILLAPITARLIREWITTQNVSVDWERFSPMRFVETAKATNS